MYEVNLLFSLHISVNNRFTGEKQNVKERYWAIAVDITNRCCHGWMVAFMPPAASNLSYRPGILSLSSAVDYAIYWKVPRHPAAACYSLHSAVRFVGGFARRMDEKLTIGHGEHYWRQTVGFYYSFLRRTEAPWLLRPITYYCCEKSKNKNRVFKYSFILYIIPHDHLLLDSTPSIGPLISRWGLDKFKNHWNKSFRTSKILTLLYQKFSNLLISKRDMSGPRLGALSNNR
jgi:hypothetical protein